MAKAGIEPDISVSEPHAIPSRQLKKGWGERFADAFEEVGVEDTEDMAMMPAATWVELEAALVAAGAKSMQVEKIKSAVATAGGAVDVGIQPQKPIAPAPSNPSPRKAQFSKTFSCFLSHHVINSNYFLVGKLTESRRIHLVTLP